MVRSLTLLHEKINYLVQQQDWEGLVAIDDKVRELIAQAINESQTIERDQLVRELTILHDAYKQAIDKMQASQGQSAQELSSVQKSLKAAKSYLDSSKF